MTTVQTLASIEPTLKELLLQLGVTEAQHIHEEPEVRRRKLLKMALEALNKLDRSNGSEMSIETYKGQDPMEDYMQRFGPPRSA